MQCSYRSRLLLNDAITVHSEGSSQHLVVEAKEMIQSIDIIVDFNLLELYAKALIYFWFIQRPVALHGGNTVLSNHGVVNSENCNVTVK